MSIWAIERRPASPARWAFVAGLAAWLLLAAGIDNGLVGVFHDDGIYLASARALRDGQGYQLPGRPGSPRPKYPPGLPILLAGAMRLLPGHPSLGQDFLAARAVVLGSGIAYFLACRAWMRRLRVPPWAATLAVLAAAFHPATLVGCASAIFADLTFAAVTYGLLWLLASRMPGALAGATGGALATAGCLVRGNGLTFVPTLLVGLAGEGGRIRSTVAATAAGLAVMTAAIAIAGTGKGQESDAAGYLGELRAGWTSPAAGAAVVKRNLRATAFELPLRVVLPATNYVAPAVRFLDARPAALWGARVLAAVVVAAGLIRLGRRAGRRALPVACHASGTVAIFLPWPWTMILDRFLLGLFPLVFLGAWAGAAVALRRLRLAGPRPARRIALAALAVAALGSVAVSARAIAVFHAGGRQWPGASDRRDLADALGRIRDLVGPDAVVAARWPETVWLYAGRPAVPLTEDEDLLHARFDRPEKLLGRIRRDPTRPFYLLVRTEREDPSGADLRQAASLAPYDLRMETVFTSEDDRYRLVCVVDPVRPPGTSGFPPR